MSTVFNFTFVPWFRSVAPYIHMHRGKTFVVGIAGEAIAAGKLHHLAQDLALIQSMGVKIVLVHGFRPQVNEQLRAKGHEARYSHGIRITDEVALDCAQEAAGQLRYEIEAAFSQGLPNTPMAGSTVRVISGNFITARPVGVVDGVDFQHSGLVRKVDVAGIQRTLDFGAMVLLSPFGFSPTGEAFNLTMEEVATSVAIALQADKLVFDSHNGRRIVLATNVAETSLTVPGIRYVIDSGTARVKRYSFRSKVEQLLVEPISQAAANQRAGRCGRVADGICIRLYDEKDFAGRPRFTDPEILRSSLAGVILRMKSLHLGDVAQFPFIEAPSGRAIADGYQLLNELGAVDDSNELTPIGRELSRLPLDPRVGRMILEARHRNALDEVVVIASALSVQDVRDRPMDAQQQADQAHAKFDDEKSEFSGYLKLWKWINDARGGHGKEHKLSNRQYEQLLRQNFVNVRRVREWRDTHTQLHTVVAEHGWRLNTTPATYEQLHLSMLAGLLGNIGCKLDDEEVYLGARGIKCHRHPGAHLNKKPGRWLVAAELVETTRLFGRGLAGL